MKDARTPALINAIMVAVRIPLLIVCAGLDENLIIPGMAVATSISYLVGAIAGEIWLRSRYGPMGTKRTLVTLLKMTVAGGAGAAAALLATNRLLQVEDLGEAVLEILLGGTVGLLVIAAVGTALKVEELVPLRNRIAGLAARILRRGSPNPGAAPNVKDTDGGTLTGDAYSPAARSDAAHGRHEQRTMAMMTVIDIQSDPHSISREQVANPVPNDSGGPAVRGADADSDTETVVTGPDPASTVLTFGSADDTLVTVHDDDPAPADDVLDPESTTVIPAEQTLPTTSGQVARLDGAAPALTPGTTVGGRYRLVSLVSADNSGHWFWRAKDTVLPRDMAVTMLPDTSGASATVARTLRAGRLHHIGLPQTLDVGTDHGQSYVVGQWVDGATLTDLLSGGPLEADVATSITAKLSEAVAEAHRNGVAFGAINPSLVRVNFDGQVRLSHVIAHGSATPDQDIKAIGALLYLMLTGTWPLGDPIKPGGAGSADGTTTGRELAAAPTRLGRELPADEVRPDVPEALSALAERALHPEEPDGIHAVGAIAALLRSPETVAGIAQAPPVPEAKPLSPADRRLIKERRVKLSLASVVLAVFAVLIVIAIGGLTNQFVASIQNSAPDELPIIDSTASPTDASPTPTADPATTAGSAAASATGAASVAVKPVAGLVFDPQGDGTPDYKDYVDRAFDGNPDSAWLTWVYKGQFPSLKTGVGLLLELDHETTPTSVTVTSATNGTVVEIRSAASPTTTLDQTTVLGSGTVAGGTVTIPLTAAPKSKYLIVFVTKMAPTSDNQFQSKINEVTVQGS
jgi:putative peptidoglycan lipid II flippase